MASNSVVMKKDETILDGLEDDLFPEPVKTNLRNKLTETDIPIIRELLQKGWRQKQIAEKFNVEVSTISSIKINKTWRHVPINEDEQLVKSVGMGLYGADLIPAASSIYDGATHSAVFLDEHATVQQNLFGNTEPIKQSEPPIEDVYPVLMGQAILDIKSLTGKREKQAKEALEAATVRMMAEASPDCFYIPGNTASSKNSKEIGFYLKKNQLTGKMEKINILVDSKVTKRYRKTTAGYWLQNKVEFLNQTRHLPLPLMVEFTFIRDSMRRSDFVNMAQVICDLMTDNGWIPDDDTIHICPVFNPVVYYHQELAGVLIRVIR